MAKRDGSINLIELAKLYSDEDSAIALLERLRWPSGAACPKCGGADPYRLKPKASGKNPARKGLFKCRACRKQFSITTGTVFESSHIPVSKWLMALHLLCASKKGISAHQLHRMLGVTYRAAWFMAHRLRHAMSQDDLLSKLAGVVEVDEAYIGGKRKGSKGRYPANFGVKPAVAVLVERGGRARAFPLERVNAENMEAALVRHCDAQRTSLMTDEATFYGGRKRIGGMDRTTVDHHLGEFVRGSAHTNTAEGFFSLLKRGIVGTFHHVSTGHLGRYVTEFEFRYNNRIALGVNDGQRAARLVLGAEGKRLTYRQPAANSAA